MFIYASVCHRNANKRSDQKDQFFCGSQHTLNGFKYRRYQY